MSGTANGRSPRSVALVGPYGGGKSALFDALMEAAGSPVKRPADPRNRPSTTELRLGHCQYLGDTWSVLDCPGSIEFAHEVAAALTVVDLAVVVCEPTPARALAVSPLLKQLARSWRAAPGVHQQDRHAGRQRRRHAGRPAGVCAVAAGAAPGADPPQRDHLRLRRRGQRARLSLPQGPAVRADPDPLGNDRGRAGSPEQAGRGAGRSRRRPAGKGAGGHQADLGGDLCRPAQGPCRRRGDRGAAGRRGQRARRASAMESAAARHPVHRRDPRAAQASPPTGRRSPRSSRRCMPAIPANCRMPGSGAARSRTGSRWAATGSAASTTSPAAIWRSAQRPRPASWWRWAGWKAWRPARRSRQTRRPNNCRSRRRRRRSIRWRSIPPTARTTSSSPARCRSCWRKTRP